MSVMLEEIDKRCDHKLMMVTGVGGGSGRLHSKDSLTDHLHLLMKDEEALILEHRLHHRLVSGQSLHSQAACLVFVQMVQPIVRERKQVASEKKKRRGWVALL